jgi:hypothetical protein
MLFSATEPGTAFAAGITGVYMTLDSGCSQSGSDGGCGPGGPGEKWHRILDSASNACQPTSMFFDPDEPDGRALHVGCNPRGALKLLGIPRPHDWRRLDRSGLRVRPDPATLQLVTTGLFPPQPAGSHPARPMEDADQEGCRVEPARDLVTGRVADRDDAARRSRRRPCRARAASGSTTARRRC